MITLALAHPWLVLTLFGGAWAVYLIPGLLPLAIKAVAMLGGLLRRLISTEGGRALLWLALVVGLAWWFRTVSNPRAFAHGRAAGIAEVQARYVKDQLEAARQALSRDATSAKATDTARSAIDARTADLNSRRSTAEGYARGRPTVPAVCPDPLPDLVRVDTEGRARVSASEARLRNLRSADSGGARPTDRK